MPCYPTVTFPNHYSIATGCYVDKHGIVLNYFTDKKYGRYTHKTAKYPYSYDDGHFYDAEPIWTTAEKQGIKTIPLYWVGNEAEINETLPSYWQYFTYGFDYGQRSDTIIKYISLPKSERADFAMLYFEEPDALGHDEGPDSSHIPAMVATLDSLMGVLCRKLNALPNSKKHKSHHFIRSWNGSLRQLKSDNSRPLF
jgi:Uncharacterized proteins of the AP superfamily